MKSIGRVAASVVSAIPDLLLGATFLSAWIRPSAVPLTIPRLHLIAILEFFIIHSSSLMAIVAILQVGVRRKLLVILGFSLFYSVFVGALAIATGSYWPLAAFWGLTLNRLLRILLGGAFSENEKTLLLVEWAIAMTFYIVLIAVTTVVPIPSLGLEPATVPANESESGLWVDDPQRGLAFGFLYFTSIGIASLLTARLLPRRTRDAMGRRRLNGEVRVKSEE